MTRARELGKLANRNSLTADNTNNFVGIGSTQPDARLDVDGTVLVGTAITIGGASGIVSATAFYGDGSNLDGVASAGLGTALAETQPGSVIYYTDSVLGIGSTVVVDPPTSTNVAYTQYSEISVDENVDFIVAEGDDFVPDILGIGTVGITTLTGIGGRIRAGTFTNKAGTGAPQLTFGAEIPVGYGLTGAGGINVGGAATISGNLTVGGVLTYDDVTNVDSLGIVTARGGFEIGASGVGGTITAAGAVEFAGIVTATSFSGNISGGTVAGSTGTFTGDVDIADKIIHTGDTNTAIRFPAADTFTVETAGSERFRVTSTGGLHLNNAELMERVNITAGKLSDNQNINLDNGMAHLFTTTETTTSTPNIISTAGINTNMATGDVLSVSIITTTAAAAYSERIKIDGLLTGITTSWNGGSAPSAGGSSGKDFYSYTIIKTGDAAFTVLGNLSNFA
jgi:hypothetical protein